MKTAFLVVQIIVSLLLISLILVQAKGTGLGSAWGGGGEFYRSKRGVEKIFYTATVALGALFLLISVVNSLLG